MTNIHPLFAGVLEQHFPGLQQPAPLEAEEEEFIPCDSCHGPATHQVYDPGDPSVGCYAGWVDFCDDCDPRRGR
jgi:hypothetical protein